MMVLLLVLFLIIILIGTPVGFAMGTLTNISFSFLGGDQSMIAQKLFSGIDTYTYVCILLFILATDLMSVGGITSAIVNFCEKLVGHIKGGLAHVNVLASMLFAGLSGSAIADASGLGPVEIQLMTDGGYDRDFSASVTAASAIIGPIIPPSNIMIIFSGCIGTVSVGKMFLAGAIPGVFLGIAYMAICYFMAVRYHMPYRKKRSSAKEILRSLVDTLPALLLPIIIMGSIISGICTATESSALAVAYAMIVSLLKRRLTWKTFKESCIRSAKATANVLFIIAASTAMGWAITTLQIAQTLAAFCLEFITSKFMFLLFMNILLLILGMVLDATPAILLMVPILWPVAQVYNISDIQFGIIMCLNLMIGNLTPPVGMMLFVISNVGKVKLSALYRGILPFVGVAVAVLLIVTYVPEVSTFIPNLLMP
ncbi:TRAP transporter large permease [Schaedlerella arabinosiphila]|jgi:TRAP transporter, DctM subunit|uniref:TRAP transporter large permease n=1 Tax=Schaedlerella arabinosiphila TaxID=2044587 RepID=A0A3R8L0U4_9FIRM|nr:TRAP transporter large permease [Schaedlerella arabinosiphila]